MIAVFFPGQGTRLDYRDILSPHLKEDRAALSALFNIDIDNLLSTESQAIMKSTYISQITAFSYGWLSWVLASKINKVFDNFSSDELVFCGHSVGEFVCLAASGALPLSEAVQLVDIRGKLMQQACESHNTGMAAFLHRHAMKLSDIIRLDNPSLTLSNFNSPTQIVFSGSNEDLNDLSSYITHNHGGKIIPLPVQGAFHSSYMHHPNQLFSNYLSTVSSNDFINPILSNVDGRCYSNWNSYLPQIISHMESPVRWDLCSNTLIAKGVTHIWEPGRKKTLSQFSIQFGLNAFQIN